METVLSVSGLVFVLLLGHRDLAGPSQQRDEPVAPVLAGLQLARRGGCPASSCRAPAPRSARPRASWSTSCCGIDLASAETRIRSYGAASGQPSTPGCAGRIEAQCVRRPRQVLGPPLGQLRHQLHADDRPCSPGQVREQRGGPPRPGADVEDPVARAARRAAAASPPRSGAGSWSARARSGSVRRSRRAAGPGGAGTPHAALRRKAALTGIHGAHSTTRPSVDATAFVDTPATSAPPIRNTTAIDSGPMFFRVRTSLTERPGALALLATRCGDAGLNIMGLQIFPDLGSGHRRAGDQCARGLDRGCGRRAREWCRRGRGERRTLHHSRPDRPADAMAHRGARRGGGSRAAADPAGEAARARTPRSGAPPSTRGPRPCARSRSRSTASRPRRTPPRWSTTRPTSGVVARIGAHVVGVAAFALTERPRADHRGRAGLAATRDRHQPAHPGGLAGGRRGGWTRSCCWHRPRTRVSWLDGVRRRAAGPDQGERRACCRRGSSSPAYAARRVLRQADGGAARRSGRDPPLDWEPIARTGRAPGSMTQGPQNSPTSSRRSA